MQFIGIKKILTRIKIILIATNCRLMGENINIIGDEFLLLLIRSEKL